jgi:hypothetical protein
MPWTRNDFKRGQARTLTRLIHDAYFNIDNMRFDEPAGVWSLPIGSNKLGPFERELRITGAKAVRVRDTERIGIYDIGALKFDDRRQELELVCNVPLGVRIEVNPDFVVFLNDVS